MAEHRRIYAPAAGLGELSANVRRRVVVADFPWQIRIGEVDGPLSFVVPGDEEETRGPVALPRQVAPPACPRRANELLRREVVAVAHKGDPERGDHLRICQIGDIHDT